VRRGAVDQRFAAADSAALDCRDLLAQRVAASLTVGAGTLVPVLGLVVVLIVRPRRDAHELIQPNPRENDMQITKNSIEHTRSSRGSSQPRVGDKLTKHVK
jgi:hypothetical protein